MEDAGLEEKGNARRQASTFSPPTSRSNQTALLSGKGKVLRGFVTTELSVKIKREAAQPAFCNVWLEFLLKL